MNRAMGPFPGQGRLAGAGQGGPAVRRLGNLSRGSEAGCNKVAGEPAGDTRWFQGQGLLIQNIVGRIDVFSVDQDLIVQVGACGNAGAAHQGDGLTPPDRLALGHIDL